MTTESDFSEDVSDHLPNSTLTLQTPSTTTTTLSPVITPNPTAITSRQRVYEPRGTSLMSFYLHGKFAMLLFLAL